MSLKHQQMFTGGAAKAAELQVANRWSSHEDWSLCGLVGMSTKDGVRYAVTEQPKNETTRMA